MLSNSYSIWCRWCWCIKRQQQQQQQQRQRRLQRRTPTLQGCPQHLQLSLVLVLLALMTTGIGAAPAKKPPPPSQRPPPPLPVPSATSVSLVLQGKLQYRTTRPTGTWLLTGVTVNKVTTNYQLPGQPVDATMGTPIPPGRTISLTCILPGPRSNMCSSVANAKITLAAAPVLSTNVTLRVLAMVVSLSDSADCGSRRGANVTDVRNGFLAPNGYADFFSNCSYGKMAFDRQALTVVSTAVNCSLPLMRCNEDAIASAAQQQATASGLKIGSYTHFLYVLPVDMNVICGWVGLAELPGTQSWFTADSQGIFSKGTVMQEMLHNFGLYHGWMNGMEYNDESTAMGFGDSCPSAPELSRLGWATPLVELNSSSFPVATFRTFILPATYLGPQGVMIKIRPDWLEFYTKNVYMALRVKAGGDINLLDKFNGKLNIHELKKDIDNDFTAPGDPMVSFIGVIGDNSSVAYFNYKLFLLTGAYDAVMSSIPLKICRFVDGPNECADVPESPLSPPSPSPPPPPASPRRPSRTSPPPPRPSPLPPPPRSPPPPPPSPPPPPPPSPPPPPPPKPPPPPPPSPPPPPPPSPPPPPPPSPPPPPPPRPLPPPPPSPPPPPPPSPPPPPPPPPSPPPPPPPISSPPPPPSSPPPPPPSSLPPPPPTQSEPTALQNHPFPPSPEDREALPPPSTSNSPRPSPDGDRDVQPPPRERSPPRTPSPARSPPKERSPPRTPSPRRSNDD